MRDAVAHSIAALLLLIFALRAFDLARTYGPTFDETAHLGAGISYVQTHDYRLNAEHPALPKLLAGWCASRTGVKGAYESVAWMRGEQWDFARETIYKGGADWRQVLTWGRIPMIAIGVALGLILWVWSRSLLGNEGALLALILFTFCPNILAHTSLVTTDVPLTCAVVGAVACLWCAHRTGRALWILAGALFFAGAMVTKYSAFSYFPVLVLLALWPSSVRSLRKSVAHAALFAVAGVTLSMALVFVTYGGAHDWTSIESLGMRGRGIDAGKLGILRRIPIEFLARIPWPSEDFARGFKDILLFTQAGHPVYLLGMRSDSGWWWSSFVTLAVKSTIPFLILVVTGAAFAFFSPRLRRTDLVFVLAPPALCLATNLAANLGLGIRHLLPMFPFLMILAAWPLRGGGFPGGLGALALVGGLATWHAASSVRAHPQELAYFNEVAGGARGGFRILGDSNLDWGQDLPRAAARLEKLGVRRAILCYFGTSDPFAFGIEWQLLPPGQRDKRFDPWIVLPPDGEEWLVISATNLQGIYTRGAQKDAGAKPYPWLEALEPREVIGGSIYLYEISQSAAAQEGLVKEYLRYGMREEAYPALLRWNQLAPGDPEAAKMLEEARAAGAGASS